MDTLNVVLSPGADAVSTKRDMRKELFHNTIRVYSHGPIMYQVLSSHGIHFRACMFSHWFLGSTFQVIACLPHLIIVNKTITLQGHVTTKQNTYGKTKWNSQKQAGPKNPAR